MNKKSIIIVSLVLIFILTFNEIIIYVINFTVDGANKRGIELYASSLKYAYANYMYKNGFYVDDIDDLEVTISTKVECEQKKISYDGKVELHGCKVENSKIKYKYVAGKVERE